MLKMFFNCQNLISLNLNSFNTSQVTSMKEMFSGCQKLISLNLKSFNTSKVTTMENMFYNCHNLESLNLNSFNTPKVTTMKNMLFNCHNLQKLILGEFKNTLTTIMTGIFQNCSKLKSLDLSKFYTPKVKNMNNVFYNDHSLKSLDLSSFVTSQVTNMASMFFGCKGLIMLIIGHFQTKKVTAMNSMFESCSKLKYLDFRNINTKKISNMNRIFYGCSSLIYMDLYYINKQASNRKNMLTNTATDFTYCIKDISKIKNIITSLNKLKAENNCSKNYYFNISKELIDFEEENSDMLYSSDISDISYIEQDEFIDNYDSLFLEDNKNFSNQIGETLLSSEIEKKSVDLIIESSVIKIMKSSSIIENKNKKIYEEIINNIIKNFDCSGQQKIIKGEDNHYFLISSYDNELLKEQIKNKSNPFSIIDLGECENILREKNNLSKNISLNNFKIRKIK